MVFDAISKILPGMSPIQNPFGDAETKTTEKKIFSLVQAGQDVYMHITSNQPIGHEIKSTQDADQFLNGSIETTGHSFYGAAKNPSLPGYLDFKI